MGVLSWIVLGLIAPLVFQVYLTRFVKLLLLVDRLLVPCLSARLLVTNLHMLQSPHTR